MDLQIEFDWRLAQCVIVVTKCDGVCVQGSLEKSTSIVRNEK